eukprot:CAMPEP_0115030540 /NCGR_PEP_ID=MMETSP0216-20121206/37870_1 /TAXON_ID=223996 /ORGANISM="Protocruzia adherens, Strain Boccale" /LENGTH=331 /DNA_ID=CAMNT_0002407761 /DNA_START=459 /DNA_END=1451 /DNA_ORIENTATION=+
MMPFLDSRIFSLSWKSPDRAYFRKGVELDVFGLPAFTAQFEDRWFTHPKQKVTFEKNDKRSAVFVNFQVVDIPGLCEKGSDFLEVVTQLDSDHAIFDSNLLTLYLKLKWIQFGKREHIRNLTLFLFFALLYTLHTSIFLELKVYYPDKIALLTIALLLQCLLLVALFYGLFMEYLKISATKTPIRHYLSSCWNIITLSTYIWLFTTIITDFSLLTTLSPQNSNTNYNTVRCMYSAGFLLLAPKILSYFRGFDSTSVVVNMILTSFWHMRSFGLVFVVVTYCFSFSAFMVVDDDSVAVGDVGGYVWEGFKRNYLVLVGQADVHDSFIGDWVW